MQYKMPKKLKKKLLIILDKDSIEFLTKLGWRGKNHIAAGIIRSIMS